jgi:hypothetical protein
MNVTGVPAMRVEDYFAGQEAPVTPRAYPQLVYRQDVAPAAPSDHSGVYIALGVVGIALLAVFVGSSLSHGGGGGGRARAKCSCRRR